ncbi:MAG: peptidyl-prolyl cis-trans isomerase [Desulfobacterales bacterium]|nr:peptidyl-prolyl cis-trans isomerase [Desulfobacterales bacterium]
MSPFWTCCQMVHAEPVQQPKVHIVTSMGEFVIQLNPQAAPKTVDNFLSYVNSGFYTNTTFHRVIKQFMIQGGGLSSDLKSKSTNDPIPNEADNGLKNLRGTIAMARTMDPNSATAQFFINTKNNSFLDFKAKTMQGWGYCVFGMVISGMDVIDAIENVETTSISGHDDVPKTPILIQKAFTEDTLSKQPSHP